RRRFYATTFGVPFAVMSGPDTNAARPAQRFESASMPPCADARDATGTDSLNSADPDTLTNDQPTPRRTSEATTPPVSSGQRIADRSDARKITRPAPIVARAPHLS